MQDIELRARDVISSILGIQKDYMNDKNGGNVMVVRFCYPKATVAPLRVYQMLPLAVRKLPG